jgi:hypothetical protein
MVYVCSLFALVLAISVYRAEPGGVRKVLIGFCLLNLLGMAQGLYEDGLEPLGVKGHAHVNEASYKGP